MEPDRISVRLPDHLRRGVEAIARERDVSVGQIVRDLLAREVTRRRAARPPVRADERLVAPLRARLAGDLAGARDWDDLQARLRRKGFTLREAGGGLALHEWPDDRRLCKASELGFSYSRLMRRFGAPFPGHRHRSLEDRVLGPDGADDDPLIEPF